MESRNFFQKIYNKLKDKIRILINKKNFDDKYWDYAKSLDLTTTLGLILSSKKILEGSLKKDKFISTLSSKRNRVSSDLKIILETLDNLLRAKNISVYKRSDLPELCWNCGEELFDPLTLKCSQCGSDPYSLCDSMTAVIEF